MWGTECVYVSRRKVEISIYIFFAIYFQTQSTYAASNISESSTQLNIETAETVSNIIRRPSMEKSKLRLHLDVVPPPPPPRTVTLLKPTISSQSGKSVSKYPIDLFEEMSKNFIFELFELF